MLRFNLTQKDKTQDLNFVYVETGRNSGRTEMCKSRRLPVVPCIVEGWLTFSGHAYMTAVADTDLFNLRPKF